jgi:2-methylcitrate dehydratase PrpD
MPDSSAADRAVRTGSAERIAAFAARLRWDDIPEAVRTRAKIQMLDALGVGIAFARSRAADATLAGIAAFGGGACSVVGRPERLAVRDAAMANGFLMHGLDFDDTHLAAIVHSSVASLPAALAVADDTDADGRALLVAYVAAMEVAIRVGLAARGEFHHAGFHATAIAAHFAGAVGAGALLGLSAEQLVMAQGIVAGTASGVQIYLEEGAWNKRLHPGWGAAAGITAAVLARHGFAGARRPYEGRFGLFETHLQDRLAEADLSLLHAGLGEHWHLTETAIKPYPVCHFIHGAADAAVALHAEIGDVSRIASGRVLLPAPTLPIVAEPAAEKRRPVGEYAAKFSAPFVVATCLRLGRFGLAELADAALSDPETLALTDKLECASDPDTGYPAYFSGGVELTLHDGTTLRRHVRVNSGAGERALTEAEAARKFQGCAAMTMEPDAAARACDAVLTLEKRPVRATLAQLVRH